MTDNSVQPLTYILKYFLIIYRHWLNFVHAQFALSSILWVIIFVFDFVFKVLSQKMKMAEIQGEHLPFKLQVMVCSCGS